MNLLSQSDWDSITQAFIDAGDTFANKPIIWRRAKVNPSTNRYGESGGKQFDDIPLSCLANYNYFRTWPVTNNTETGEQDRESVQILFSKPYLQVLGYLDEKGYLTFDPGYDRFIFEGKVCKASGDTSVSQLQGSDAWFSIILRREELTTGE